jgi:hypothetical protein
MPNDMTSLCGIKRNLYGISIAIYDEEKLLVSSNNAYRFDLGCIEVDATDDVRIGRSLVLTTNASLGTAPCQTKTQTR